MNYSLEQIKDLRKQGKTLAQIGRKVGITAERVRQLLHPLKKKICKKHDIVYYGNFCKYCKVRLIYMSILQDCLSSKKLLRQEIERLRMQDKQKETVIQRIMLIKFLKNTNVSFTQIAKLLGRDLSSIKNLYEKKEY